MTEQREDHLQAVEDMLFNRRMYNASMAWQHVALHALDRLDALLKPTAEEDTPAPRFTVAEKRHLLALRALGATDEVRDALSSLVAAGLTAAQLRDVATGLKRGGVGYYPEDNFVHVDIGRVRYW